MGRINLPLNPPPLLADVAAPTVTPVGQDDSETWEYAIVGVTSNGGRSLVSSNGTTAVGATALNDTDRNTVTWTDVAGYERYEIWRQVAAGVHVTGLVGLAGPGIQTFDDVGSVPDVGDHRGPITPSAANTSGIGRVVDLAQFKNEVEALLENVGVGTYEVQTSQDRTAWTIEGVALTADGARTIAIDKRWLRIENTAFTSGTPRGFAVGDFQ